MTAFPGATPVTTPVLLLTVAIPVLALVHTPPVVALDKAVVPAGHTLSVPVIAETVGMAFTVNEAALVPVPDGVVTLIGPLVAPTGSVVVIWVALFTVKGVAGVPLKLTAVAPVKLVPVMTTVVGVVPAQPLLGVKLLTVVTAGRKITMSPPLRSAPDIVTVPFPVAPIVGLSNHAAPTVERPAF